MIDQFLSHPAQESDANLDILIDAVEALSGARDEAEIGRIVRRAARRLTKADGICVVLKEGGQVHYLDEDAVGPLWKGGKFPLESCISGWAIENRQTVVIPDIYQDARIPHDLYRQTFVQSLVMAPVRPSQPIAAIGAYWAKVRRPTDQEVHNLETIARATAVAMENVRLRCLADDALARAEAASRAKNDFLTNISHEIRTPLNGVLGAAQVLAFSGGLSSAQANLIKLIRTSGGELDRVIGDVLDFADLQAAEITLASESFHLGDLVRASAQLYSLRFDAKGLILHVEIDPRAEVSVTGDPGRIRQIILRLLDNALKFTDFGEVTLRAAPDVLHNQYKITVSDSGPGLPADTARLFNAFEQGDNSSTRGAGGAGLGLAISRRLAISMGGSLEAVPRANGAQFELSLILKPSADQVGEAKPPVPVPSSNLKVLLVDDHALSMEITEMMLSGLGVDVSRSRNGEEACHEFSTHRFDLILMDVNMPVMDGMAATRAIRALELERRQAPTPIIMLTANGRLDDIQAGLAAGADSYVSKPIQITALLEAIHQVLSHRLAA